jgi:thiazole synthase
MQSLKFAGSVERQLIAKSTKAANRSFCNRRNETLVPELFARGGIGKMHLDHRCGDRLDRVEQGDRCMGQGAGVDDHRMGLIGRGFVQPVDQMAFMIALPNIDVETQRLRMVFNLSGDFVERLRTIYFGFAHAQQVEIGSVQYKDGLGRQDIGSSPRLLVATGAPSLYGSYLKSEIKDMKVTEMAEIQIRLNGDDHKFAAGGSIADLVRSLDLDPAKVAVERNREIVTRSTLEDVMVEPGDELEIVHFVGGGSGDDSWTVAGRTFRSRLIVGTGKYKDFAENAAAVEASGAEIVTVAVRRVNVTDRNQPVLMDFIDPKKVTYLPNTAGCFNAEDAIRTLRLAREAGGWDLVKLEVLGEAKTLYPNMRETLEATEVLAREGFKPMVYCVDDPIAAKQLEDAGAVAIMPLGAPIGSGLGIQNRVTIRLIVEGAKVPVLVDAGVGTASDAAVAMELGCDGVLMNTAIAEAKEPVRMARAMRLAVEAGREAYRSGRMGRRMYADPSSPLSGLI